ncbi:MAG: hypothetical protein HYR55_08160 [Acidobacteria bacterium]|nr:hypothetical protein [Acidobacteriota bacterium]MBI3656558.1 hypothetical protein [Acidobacteriota bacterium]
MTKKSLITLVIIIIVIGVNLVNFGAYFVRDDFVIVKGIRDGAEGSGAKLFGKDFMRNFWPVFSNWEGKDPTYSSYALSPTAIATFKLNFGLGGASPFGYHLVNVLLHILNVLLFFQLMEIIFSEKRLSLAASMIFAAHPVAAHAVANISGRNEALGGLFYLLTFFLFVQYRKGSSKIYYWISFGTFLLGLFTKAALLTLPVLLVLYDLTLGDPGARDWRSLRSLMAKARKSYSNWIPYVALILVFFMARKFIFGNALRGYDGHFSQLTVNITAKVTDVIAFVRYGFLACPFDAQYQAPIAVWEVLGLFAMILVYLVPSLYCGLLSFPLFPVLLLGFVWVLLAMALALFNPRIVSANLYLPSMGIACLLAGTALSLYKKKFGMLVLAATIAFYGVLQFQYNSAYAKAGHVAKSVIRQVEKISETAQPAGAIVLLNTRAVPGTNEHLRDGLLPTTFAEPFSQAHALDRFNVWQFDGDEFRQSIEYLREYEAKVEPPLELVKWFRIGHPFILHPWRRLFLEAYRAEAIILGEADQKEFEKSKTAAYSIPFGPDLHLIQWDAVKKSADLVMAIALPLSRITMDRRAADCFGVGTLTLEGNTDDVIIQHPESEMTFRKILIPEDRVLRIVFGVQPRKPTQPGKLLISAFAGSAGSTRELIYSAEMEMDGRMDSKMWREEFVDLTRFSNQEIDLTFRVDGDHQEPNTSWVGWINLDIGRKPD